MSVTAVNQTNFQNEVLRADQTGPAGLLGALVRPLPDAQPGGG